MRTTIAARADPDRLHAVDAMTRLSTDWDAVTELAPAMAARRASTPPVGDDQEQKWRQAPHLVAQVSWEASQCRSCFDEVLKGGLHLGQLLSGRGKVVNDIRV